MTAIGVPSSADPDASLPRYAALARLAGRILTSPIFLSSGIGKIMNPGTCLGYIAAFGPATALIFPSRFGNQNEFLHVWKSVAMAGGLLQLVAFGAGRLGLETRRPRRPARWGAAIPPALPEGLRRLR